MTWSPTRCVFGPGLTALDADGEVLLIVPYAACDGSGRVGGHGLMAGRLTLARFPGVTLSQAAGLAELELARREPLSVCQGTRRSA